MLWSRQEVTEIDRTKPQLNKNFPRSMLPGGKVRCATDWPMLLLYIAFCFAMIYVIFAASATADLNRLVHRRRLPHTKPEQEASSCNTFSSR